MRDVEPFSGRKSIRNPRKIYPAKTGQGDIRMLGWSDFYVSIHVISIIRENLSYDVTVIQWIMSCHKYCYEHLTHLS